MKKLLLIITMLTLCLGSVWAQITVGPSTGMYMDAWDGWNDGNIWSAYWKSSATTSDMSTPLLKFNSKTGMNNTNGNIYSNQSYTLAAPDGYTISSYTFNGTATSGDVTITPSGGSDTKINSGNRLANDMSVTVNSQSTTFALSGSGHIENLNLVVTVTPVVNVTIAYCPSYTTSGCSHSLPSAYGSFSGQTYTTNASSNMQGVTITASSGLSIGEELVNVNDYGKCFKLVTAAAATDYTVTLQAPIDYVITGYRIGGSANTRDAKHTLTSADGSVVAEVTCPVDQNNQPKDFNVTGLNTNTTYFTINTQNSGNTLYLPIFQVYIAPASEVVNDTYNVIFNGSQVATKTVTRILGITSSDPILPSVLEKDKCTYEYYADASCTTSISALTASGTTIYAKCAYPFTVSTNFATATWYNATLRGKYLRADDSHKDGSDRYATNSTNGHSRFYKWAFFGNPYDGIYIMNKGQGDGKYLYLNNQLGFKSDITPTKENNALFEISSNSNGGFTLRNIGGGATCYVNDNGGGDSTSGNLGLWNDSRGANDAGSKWVVTEDVSVVLSELSNNKKYKISCERGSLSTSTNSEATYLASTAKTGLNIEAKDFAIINYDNKYYLYSVSDKKIVTYQSETIAPLVDDITGTTSVIAFVEKSSGSGIYGIRFNNESSKNLNSCDHTDYPYAIAINDYTTWDNGNQYVIDEVDDFDPKEALGVISGYNDIVAQLKAINWSDEGKAGQLNRYNLTDNYVGQAGHENAWIESLEDFGYSESNLTTVQYLINHYALNMPTAGMFLRVKGGSSGKYVKYNGVEGKYPMTDTPDDAAIFYYDGNHLMTYSSGIYWGVTGGSWAWTEAGGTGSNITFAESNTSSKYFVQVPKNNDDKPYVLLYDNGENNSCDRGAFSDLSTATDDRYTWNLEEVTSLPLSISAGSYTSFSAPVAIKIPDNCYAYIATSEGEGVINMEKVAGDNKEDDVTVAANTGLIISTNGAAQELSFEIVESGKEYSTKNLLVANVAASNVSRTDNYFFGKVNGNYVFTKLSGSGYTYQLPGHKAYLHLASGGARMSINWGVDDPTGLHELSDDNIKLKDGKYYQNGTIVIVRNGVKYNVAGQTIK